MLQFGRNRIYILRKGCLTEEIKTAVCPQPIRTREDDKIVEIFLHAYQDGRFAHKLEWQPQHETNVDVYPYSKRWDQTGRGAHPPF